MTKHLRDETVLLATFLASSAPGLAAAAAVGHRRGERGGPGPGPPPPPAAGTGGHRGV